MKRFVILIALCCGCLEPTEIKLVLSTDVPCQSVRQVLVFAGTTASPVLTSMKCGPDIGSVVLVPSGNHSAKGTVVVELELVNGDCFANPPGGCIVARRSVQFVEHTALTMPIQLSSSCLNVQCLADQTCVDGACTSSQPK